MNQLDWEKIAKSIAGEASAEEEAYAKKQLSQSDENKKVYNLLSESPMSTEGNELEWDVKNAWKKLRNDIHSEPSENRSVFRPSFISMIGQYFDRFSLNHGLRFATLVVIIFGASIYIESSMHKMLGKSTLQQIVTENAQKATIQLKDGTEVRLNVASSLRICDNFPENREVFLKGEAFFNVQHDNGKAFIVNTEDATITVLGTEFNVKAWNTNKEVEVFVADGKVAFASSENVDEDKVVLTKNQLSVITEGQSPTEPIIAEADKYLKWLDGGIIFDNTPFGEVASQLVRQYDLEISITDTTYLSHHLTASFGKGEPLDNILKTIAISFELEYAREGRYVTFYSERTHIFENK